MYGIVEFVEGGLAIVAEKWLTPRKKEVFWPPYKDSRNFYKVLKRQEEANSSTWTLYAIRKIFYQTDNLEIAQQKLKTAEETSNLESDLDEEPKKRKRTAPTRLVSSSSDEECSAVQRPPKINVDVPSKQTQANFQRDPSPVAPTASTSSNLSQILGDKSPSTSYSNESHIVYGPRVCPIDPGVSASVDDTAFKTLLHYIITIKEQNAQILAALKPIKKSESHNFPVTLPLSSEESLQTLEEFLCTGADIMVSFLSTTGGDGVVKTTNRMLKKLITDSLAAEYSYYGKKQKKPFSNLSLNKAIKDAVKLTCQGATDHEVERATKIWLKHAPQRLKTSVKPQTLE